MGFVAYTALIAIKLRPSESIINVNQKFEHKIHFNYGGKQLKSSADIKAVLSGIWPQATHYWICLTKQRELLSSRAAIKS